MYVTMKRELYMGNFKKADSEDEEMKKQIAKHQRSLNSSLDLDNNEDMDVEGLD